MGTKKSKGPPKKYAAARRESAREYNGVRRRKKAKRSYIIYYFLLLLIVLTSGIILSLTVFFKIETINVEGQSRYSEEQIIDVCEISPGENIFRADTQKAKDNILFSLQYCDGVVITKKLPSKIIISVTECDPDFSVKDKDAYIYLSRGGRSLETGQAKKYSKSLILKGIDLTGLAAGEFIGEEQNQKMLAVNEILAVVKEKSLTGIIDIDITDIAGIKLNYENRVDIDIGNISDINYKFDAIEQLIKQEIGKNEKGSLIYSKQQDNASGRFHFVPKH